MGPPERTRRSQSCFCDRPPPGEMVECSNSDQCPYGQWFHFVCVGVDAEQTLGTWYCPACKLLQ
eukprot:NODE_5874_length_298_cov_282.345382_g5262_i0.p1 GENE.NODE_5874_length_298_cov_282.345382_g5262_i0~~NODE_5874_length_298_cov_282.345382_g5262_i0.p1  ORF type:complete len:73 (+),score=23.42 NODE_5874_length_298_cov_282.345382_g5262_i0:28-219(+)